MADLVYKHCTFYLFYIFTFYCFFGFISLEWFCFWFGCNICSAQCQYSTRMVDLRFTFYILASSLMPNLIWIFWSKTGSRVFFFLFMYKVNLVGWLVGWLESYCCLLGVLDFFCFCIKVFFIFSLTWEYSIF